MGMQAPWQQALKSNQPAAPSQPQQHVGERLLAGEVRIEIELLTELDRGRIERVLVRAIRGRIAQTRVLLEQRDERIGWL
jgi:hypothetical protein